MRLVLILFAISLANAQIVARISATPPLMPEEVSRLEAKLAGTPSDLETRMRLLQYYTSPTDRLRHILYIIENHPSEPIAASDAAYIRDEAARQAWLRAADLNPAARANAARFLHRDHPDEAHQLLARYIDREPQNRKLAAMQGFLYALDVLGGDASARKVLDESRNAIVIGAAATAMPNLFMRAQSRAEDVFEYSRVLMERARQISPDELRGPMPLIQEFEAFMGQQPAPRIQSSSAMPARLLHKPEPVYPPEAMAARIQGTVRFQAELNAQGRIENATVVSGHPLLIPAALDALRDYRYAPTLVNGQPARIRLEIDVPFTLPPGN